MKIKSKVIDKNLCISCGLCTLNNSAKLKIKRGIYIPKFIKELTLEEDDYLYNICPGKGYAILKTSEALFKRNDVIYNNKIGYYKSIGAAYSSDKDFLINSSSGGMMPTIAWYLLNNKLVDGILTVKFIYTPEGPKPEPFIAKTKKELISSQGSKYLPIPLLNNIDLIKTFKGKLAVIGTPCQIAGLRLLQEKNKEINEKVKFTIANFCGGFRNYRETERIFKIFNVNRNKITNFSYRGNGQPGTMSIKQENKDLIQIKYPEYARLTGFTKYYRCRLCVDATGELADISFGDAWLPRFINSGKKWSFYISRSDEIDKIINNLFKTNQAIHKEITIEELLYSQKGNINTKKIRQNSRMNLYKKLFFSLPEFDGGYDKSQSNIGLELKVLISHKFLYFLERIGLYLPFARLIKRVNKNKYEIKN